jgi:organic hydroperoxide reductase OsmC/OhrA
VQQRARVFTYDVTLDRDWAARSGEGGPALQAEEEWTPEHLLLAGLARCTLTSLRHHARRAQVEVTASAAARGTVTRREEDGRFAFVEIEVDLDAAFEPRPEDVRELLGKAERDCFVGASLTVKPRYRWVVDGDEVA